MPSPPAPPSSPDRATGQHVPDPQAYLQMYECGISWYHHIS